MSVWKNLENNIKIASYANKNILFSQKRIYANDVFWVFARIVLLKRASLSQLILKRKKENIEYVADVEMIETA